MGLHSPTGSVGVHSTLCLIIGFTELSAGVVEFDSHKQMGGPSRRRVASEFGVRSWWPGRSDVPFRLSSTASIFCRLAAVYHSTYSTLLL
jgi:hypothetical protein